MKINSHYLDIESSKDNYIYTYIFITKSFLRKEKIFKFTCTLNLAHYWLTELEKIMVQKKFLFDVTPENTEIDLGIGSLIYARFTKDDLKKYGENINEWKKRLDVAVEKQMKLTEAYDEKHGIPDLSWLH